MDVRGLILAGATLCGTALHAQQPAAPPIRTTTRLVEVSCVVEGKKAPIPDLTPADFRLRDGKIEEPVQGVTMGWALDAPPPPAVRPLGFFTNRFGMGDEVSPSATVILFDGPDLPNIEQEYARKQLQKFLATVQPSERVALYTLEDGLRVLHDFSSEPALLLQALDRYSPEPKKKPLRFGPPLPPRFFAGLEEPFEAFRRRAAEAEERRRAWQSLGALEAIANRVSRFRGRKNLVWFTAGVPFDLPSNVYRASKRNAGPLDARIEQLARTLQEANITVYPVLTKSMEVSWGGVPVSYSGGTYYDAGSGTYLVGGAAETYYGPSYDSTDFWREWNLAEKTGGRAFIHSNDIAGALRRAINDARRTYVLGFYPTHSKWDGSFRKIKVELTRHFGLRLNCRKGYYALPEVIPDVPRINQTLAVAASSPLDATALGFDAEPRLWQGPDFTTLMMRVRLDPRELQLNFSDPGWTGRIYLLFVQRDANGRMLTNGGEILEVEVPMDRYAGLQKDGLVFHRRVALEENAATVRILLLEAQTGRVGSVTIPLAEVRDAQPN